MSNSTVTHNAAAQRFELTVDGLLCEATYRLKDGVMWMNHTGVPHARQHGMKIKPVCSYVVVWLRRHPEAADLVA